MYILKQGDLIVYAAETETEVNSVKSYVLFDEIIETSQKYVLKNGIYFTENEAIIKFKTEKNIENVQKAKHAVENGFVTFKNAQFETNTQTVGDLTATMLMLQNERAEAERLAVSKTEMPFNASGVNNNSLSELVSESDPLLEQSEEADETQTNTDQTLNQVQGDSLIDETLTQIQGDENLAYTSLPQNDISYTWLSKDDKAVELTLEDFITLGNLIAAYKNTIWSEKYIAFKTAIENAETIEELEEIDINYDNSDV